MKKSITIFKQFLQVISRYEFQKAMNLYKVEKNAKGLSSWNHFVAMAFGQITNQRSLKNIESGLRGNSSKLYHLGVSKTSKSTLAYANENRDYRAYKELFFILLNKVQMIAPKHHFEFSNKLTSMDATTIDLCKSQFPWADFRETKGGIKLIIKLNHNGYIPECIVDKSARSHEMNSVNRIPFEKDEIVAFDRGFSDYRFFANLYNNGTYFVTRLKKNAKYRVVKTVFESDTGILSEEIIMFDGYNSQKRCSLKLRKIISRDEETGKSITIITNNFELSAETIAKIYKDRWQIEIFFKTMKQFLKIKKYYGNSKNAVLTQIFIALIVFLLLKFLQFQTKLEISFSQLISAIAVSLYQTIEIDKLIERIIKPPPKRKAGCFSQGGLF